MLSYLFKGKSTNYSFIKISDIINFYHIPLFQRAVVKEGLDKLDQNIIKEFNPITPIYFCVYKHKRYVIDGVHRLEYYKMNNKLHDYQIPIIDIFTDNEEDIYKYFILINDQLSR